MIERIDDRELFYIFGALVGVGAAKLVDVLRWYGLREAPTLLVDQTIAVLAFVALAVLVAWRRRSEGSPQ